MKRGVSPLLPGELIRKSIAQFPAQWSSHCIHAMFTYLAAIWETWYRNGPYRELIIVIY